MNMNDFKRIADELTADLKRLANNKLYVCANAYSATANYPNRIVVEGIKNLRTTGHFTLVDRSRINIKLINFCFKYDLKLKVIDSDPGMHNAIIICK